MVSTEVKNLLEVWDINDDHPEIDSYIKRADEIIAEKNTPEKQAQRRIKQEKSNNKYRRQKIRWA
jgi:hypothetical protein